MFLDGIVGLPKLGSEASAAGASPPSHLPFKEGRPVRPGQHSVCAQGNLQIVIGFIPGGHRHISLRKKNAPTGDVSGQGSNAADTFPGDEGKHQLPNPNVLAARKM
jgi:hypothetical protein